MIRLLEEQHQAIFICFNKNLAFGYVDVEKLEKLGDKKIYIEVEKNKYEANLLSKPLNQKI